MIERLPPFCYCYDVPEQPYPGIPRRLKVCGHEIRVDVRSDMPDDQAGEYIENEQRISVSDDLGPDAIRETVMHELTHAAETAAGLDLAEHEVHAIARILYAVLRDNPDLAAWLTSK